MNIELLELRDHRAVSDEDRRDVCHIADVLPVVLARLAAMAQRDTDCRPRSVDLASHIMPAPALWRISKLPRTKRMTLMPPQVQGPRLAEV